MVDLVPLPAGPERLPRALWGVDLDRQLTLRQWTGSDCALCARWLVRSRVVATVNGRVLRACAPRCGVGS